MLTTQEKLQLRQAICDGAFSSNNPAIINPIPVDKVPEVMQTVAALSEDAIRSILAVWIPAKKQVLNMKLCKANAAVNLIQQQLAAFDS